MQAQLGAKTQQHADELQQLRDQSASDHAAAAAALEDFKKKSAMETDEAVKKANASGEQELSAERERMSAVNFLSNLLPFPVYYQLFTKYNI